MPKGLQFQVVQRMAFIRRNVKHENQVRFLVYEHLGLKGLLQTVPNIFHYSKHIPDPFQFGTIGAYGPANG